MSKTATKSGKASGGKKGKTKGKGGELSVKQRDRLDRDTFAFPVERKEPLNSASHVRNAIARFTQVKDVSDDERDRAWRRIGAAAKKYRVKVSASGWRSLGRGGEAAKKAKTKSKKKGKKSSKGKKSKRK